MLRFIRRIFCKRLSLRDVFDIISGCKGFRHLVIYYDNVVHVGYIQPSMNKKFNSIEEFEEWLTGEK